MGQPALPDCPEHPGGSVVKAGFYGSGQHRRQRYWCRPRGGAERHRFTPTLPRLVTDEHTCLDCERKVAPHEGPPTVRQYDFAVRDVAQALQSVAAGETYRAASGRIRLAAGHQGRVPNGQLVADWVEQFAEPLWQAHGPRTWPRLVVCDETTFSVRTIEGTHHQRFPTNRRDVAALPRRDVFTVCVVAGQTATMPHPRPWFAWAVAGRAAKDDWLEVFSQLEGRPQVVLSDLNPSVFNAAQAYWPTDTETGEAPPRPAYCIYHRRQKFPWPAPWRAALDRPEDPLHDKAVELARHLDGCAVSADAWEQMCQFVSAEVGPRARQWLRRMNTETVIWEQLDRRLRNEPVSNSSVEAFVRGIRGDLVGRPFTNKQRTNRLLKLITLNRRGSAENTARWSATLRTAAEANAGRTAGNQRDCCDPARAPSLH